MNEKEEIMAKSEKNFIKVVKNDGAMGFVLFAAWIGAAVYFVSRVDGFWNIVVALLKACVWPAFLVYHGLQALGA
jgi:hypothetical protein